MADLSTVDVVTKNDLENLKKELVDILPTKKELKKELSRYITKEEFKQELAQYITKEEFRQEFAKVATKEEVNTLRTELLNKLATRESVEVVARQVLKNTNEITVLRKEMRMGFNRVDDRLDSLETKFDIMMSAIDGIAREFQNGRTEKAAIDYALTRHDDRLDSHEVRITHLERKIA